MDPAASTVDQFSNFKQTNSNRSFYDIYETVIYK